MKVLFDPIYSTQPQHCSSSSKFKKVAEILLAERDDLFIYWPIPDWIDEASTAWLPQTDRIKYIKFPCSKDRVREYQVFYRELEMLLAFNGTHWDYDVLISMRTQQIPNARVIMSSPRLKRQTWMKKVLCLEEMAVLDFRKTVPVSDAYVQDMMTVAGYLSSDRSYITIDHVRQGIMNTARQYFSPSRVRELDKKLKLVSPSLIGELLVKEPKYRFKKGEQPFCLGFVGRMSNSMTRLPVIYDAIEKHWIMKGDTGFKMVFSTVSTGIKLPPPEFCTVENNPRDVFWQRVKEDMHLIISMSIDAEFSMSLMEPLLFGTPLVLAREPWTEALFGKDYPFFVKGLGQAHGMIQAFHDDYEKWYQVFLDWRKEVLEPRFKEGGPYATNLYDDIREQVIGHETECFDTLRENHPGKEENSMVTALLDKVGDRTEFRIMDVFQELADDGTLKYLGDKLKDGDRDRRNLTFSTAWNEYRLSLQTFHGWRDASTDLGHLTK